MKRITLTYTTDSGKTKTVVCFGEVAFALAWGAMLSSGPDGSSLFHNGRLKD